LVSVALVATGKFDDRDRTIIAPKSNNIIDSSVFGSASTKPVVRIEKHMISVTQG